MSLLVEPLEWPVIFIGALFLFTALNQAPFTDDVMYKALYGAVEAGIWNTRGKYTPPYIDPPSSHSAT